MKITYNEQTEATKDFNNLKDFIKTFFSEGTGYTSVEVSNGDKSITINFENNGLEYLWSCDYENGGGIESSEYSDYNEIKDEIISEVGKDNLNINI